MVLVSAYKVGGFQLLRYLRLVSVVPAVLEESATAINYTRERFLEGGKPYDVESTRLRVGSATSNECDCVAAARRWVAGLW